MIQRHHGDTDPIHGLSWFRPDQLSERVKDNRTHRSDPRVSDKNPGILRSLSMHWSRQVGGRPGICFKPSIVIGKKSKGLKTFELYISSPNAYQSKSIWKLLSSSYPGKNLSGLTQSLVVPKQKHTQVTNGSFFASLPISLLYINGNSYQLNSSTRCSGIKINSKTWGKVFNLSDLSYFHHKYSDSLASPKFS